LSHCYEKEEAMSTLRKVLVVDDDPVISRSFNRVLAGKGYIVVSAENGQDALNKVAKEEYDAVFTDIRMPGMDGIEVAEQLRAKQPWIPVVIITGYGSPDNEARAEAAGVKGFLHKPLSPEMIEKSVTATVATAQPVPAEVPQAAAVSAQPIAVGKKTAGRNIAVFLKDVLMFLAAPFIGLAFIALFPFIGLGMLAWMGGQAWRQRVTSG
jgi:CheY-like chemotaxis protein